MIAALASICMFGLTWLVSVKLTNVSIIDCVWGLSFVVLSCGAASQLETLSLSQQLLLVLVCVWGGRFSIYLTKRNFGKEEDYRYQEMRKRNDPGFWWKSIGRVFCFSVLDLICRRCPLLFVFAGGGELVSGGSFLIAIAIVAWLIGFYFEVVGDLQLTRFKKIQQPRSIA